MQKAPNKPGRFVWCGLGDSNSWPLPWQGSALTTELNPHVVCSQDYRERQCNFQALAIRYRIQVV